MTPHAPFRHLRARSINPCEACQRKAFVPEFWRPKRNRRESAQLLVLASISSIVAAYGLVTLFFALLEVIHG